MDLALPPLLQDGDASVPTCFLNMPRKHADKKSWRIWKGCWISNARSSLSLLNTFQLTTSSPKSACSLFYQNRKLNLLGTISSTANRYDEINASAVWRTVYRYSKGDWRRLCARTIGSHDNYATVTHRVAKSCPTSPVPPAGRRRSLVTDRHLLMLRCRWRSASLAAAAVYRWRSP